MSEEKKKEVVNLLKKNTEGLTIVEIANSLKFSRNTVAIILAELKGAELIRIRPIGKAIKAPKETNPITFSQYFSNRWK